MRKPSKWKSKKRPTRSYVGKYKQYGKQRAFVLYNVANKKDRVTFESHEAAKELGWKKVL